MSGVVHALLVGIDQYPDPAHRLAGCRNDVAAFEELLTLRVKPERLRLRTLVDDEATRENVIAAFRTHLGKATAADTVLFYYAGHGSRERSPEIFWTVEPDRLDETLVLWDSRQPGGWDLADKELAALIRPLAATGAHVAVILDSCHSGSGTRAFDSGVKVRRFPVDARDRPLESFLPEVQAIASARMSESGWDLGDDGRHVLLAACCDDQEAAEYHTGGVNRGAFSWYLLEALRQSPGTPTYRDLAARVRARVIANVPGQEPQIEATTDADLDRSFIEGAIQPRAKAFYTAEFEGEWWMDGGTIHGVPAPAAGESATVALFDGLGEVSATVATAKESVAVAEVVEVQGTRSRLRVTRGTLKSGETYKAVLTATPLPSHSVRLSGEAEAVAAAREALAGSPYVSEAAEHADFVLECAAGSFRLLRGADGRELVAPASTAAEGVKNAEHVAQWLHFRDLENPVSTIDPSELEVTVLADQTGERELSGPNIRLTATRTDKGLVAPKFRVRFRNLGQRDLHVGMLALDELYECNTELVKGGVLKLRPGDAAGWALDGKALKAQVPEPLRREGRTESQDVLKVIVSTAPFDISHAALTALGLPARRAAQPSIANTLERLLARGGTRTISAASDDDEIRDFLTKTIIVTTVEPAAGVEVNAATTAEVGAGVAIGAHPSLRGRARLATLTETRGDVGAAILPPLFRTPGAGETIAFSSSRGSAAPLSVLELSEVVDHTVVTPGQPLEVTLPSVTDEGDVVLPVAYDGEDYLILGSGGARKGKTVVTISRLPYPVKNRARSLGGSIRILFQKFTAPLLGKQYKYPLLTEAAWDAQGKVTYDADIAHIEAKVAKAQRIVVFVHGIIGDTRAMGAHLAPAPGDLYLTFDYENLHTTIEENAEGLKERLAACGLTKGHGKQVVLVAHSMGGLVSRWFMEKLGGREIVSRVILCGTPNAGSNWSTIEDWLTGAASLALNGLTKISWEAAAIGSLFSCLEKIDNSLDQMKPSSAFLTSLGSLDDPGIPYVVLAGNTSLAAAADAPRIERLLKKVLHKTTSVAFLFEPNDIAVSVKSIGSVGTKWKQPPDTREVACDHISYFSHPASLEQLRKLLEV
ncbi:MAG TPA: alpha/beta fold hydrolase [Thermoanaerobaculia bacterium]|nr:alpha/beta fold hydrolase [Thermoanaerobaculia bacterium]